MAVLAIDTLLAIKVVGLVEGLNGNDRRVAILLLEHFNRKTGRCDPGLVRIARLLGISERTAIRSVHRLTRAGLFHKTRHGGYGNRNKYEPVWVRFDEIERAWRGKLNRGVKLTPSNPPPQPRQPCHLEGDGPVTQTYRSNLPQITCSKRHSEKQLGAIVNSRATAGFPSGPLRSSDAARIAAERRWSDSLYRAFGDKPVTYGEIIDAIDEPIRSAATEAELNRRGDGVAYIRNKLKLGGGR